MKKGAALVVMEAMKTEHTVTAPAVERRWRGSTGRGRGGRGATLLLEFDGAETGQAWPEGHSPPHRG